MTRQDHKSLPPSLAPRGLKREIAAAFVGLSPTGFDAARRQGKYPAPTLPGGCYDRILLERAMDNLSGIAPETEAPGALDLWRQNRGPHSA